MAQKITKTQNFTANSQTMDLDVTDTQKVLLTVRGTYTLTLTFTASDDGTNFFAINGIPSNSATGASSHSTANASQGFLFDATFYNDDLELAPLEDEFLQIYE